MTIRNVEHTEAVLRGRMVLVPRCSGRIRQTVQTLAQRVRGEKTQQLIDRLASLLWLRRQRQAVLRRQRQAVLLVHPLDRLTENGSDERDVAFTAQFRAPKL